MRIVHSGSCNINAGGPALSTWLTIKGLRGEGDEVFSVMQKTNPEYLISNELNPLFTKKSILGSVSYIPNMNRVLSSIPTADIYHIQGIWMYHGKQVADFAMKHHKPYVITLRGMLYPQALSHNAFIKKLSLITYQGDMLRKASAIQVTCVEEMEHYRKLGFTNPVAILPNPIDTESVTYEPKPLNTVFRIGYLGRLHVRKRVERIIYAISDLRNKYNLDIYSTIIGGGDVQYERFLKNETARLNLNDRIKFTGFISGKEKDEAINSLSILVVPSDFENFGNIVTEALVRGVPVIASKGTPWEQLEIKKCGWWINNSQESINSSILNAFNLGHNKLHIMGQNGIEWMKSDFSVQALGKKMHTLYSWILGQSAKPDFVYD